MRLADACGKDKPLILMIALISLVFLLLIIVIALISLVLLYGDVWLALCAEIYK